MISGSAISLRNLDEVQETIQGILDEFSDLSGIDHLPDGDFLSAFMKFCMAWHTFGKESLPESVYDSFSHKVPNLTRDMMLVEMLELELRTVKKERNRDTFIAELNRCLVYCRRATSVLSGAVHLDSGEKFVVFRDILQSLVVAWHAGRVYSFPMGNENLVPNWDGDFQLVPTEHLPVSA